jgi:hypothetical protein
LLSVGLVREVSSPILQMGSQKKKKRAGAPGISSKRQKVLRANFVGEYVCCDDLVAALLKD